jgi:hypothetical protein
VAIRSSSEYLLVAELIAAGRTDQEIASAASIPRRTVHRWRKKGPPTGRKPPNRTPHDRPLDVSAYAYLLGAYLGDGCVAEVRGSSFLHLYLDRRYEGIASECADAIARTLPTRVRRYDRKPGAIVLQASSPDWPVLFPQHGRGRKHERSIALESWQEEITTVHPRAFLRGLIHSDGCRSVNRFSTRLPSGRIAQYEYARYFFSNLSADIRRIFCDHCDLLGIRWTQSNPRNISISHRSSVEAMDAFIGPKY